MIFDFWLVSKNGLFVQALRIWYF